MQVAIEVLETLIQGFADTLLVFVVLLIAKIASDWFFRSALRGTGMKDSPARTVDHQIEEQSNLAVALRRCGLGIGFGLGLERLVLLLSQNQKLAASYRSPKPEIFLAYLDEESLEKAFTLARDLRRDGIFAYVDFGRRKLRGQMRLANRLGAQFVCVIGDDEIRTRLYSIKRMADGTQTRLQQERISQHVRSA